MFSWQPYTSPVGDGDCMTPWSVMDSTPKGDGCANRNRMEICDSFMNDPETGLWKEYQAEAKTGGIIKKSALTTTARTPRMCYPRKPASC